MTEKESKYQDRWSAPSSDEGLKLSDAEKIADPNAEYDVTSYPEGLEICIRMLDFMEEAPEDQEARRAMIMGFVGSTGDA